MSLEGFLWPQEPGDIEVSPGHSHKNHGTNKGYELFFCGVLEYTPMGYIPPKYEEDRKMNSARLYPPRVSQ